MALSDEINSCDIPEGYPSGDRIVSRPTTFCEDVTIQSELTVGGPAAFGSPITVTSPVIVDGISMEPVEIIGSNGTFTVLGVMTAGAPSPGVGA